MPSGTLTREANSLCLHLLLLLSNLLRIKIKGDQDEGEFQKNDSVQKRWDESGIAPLMQKMAKVKREQILANREKDPKLSKLRAYMQMITQDDWNECFNPESATNKAAKDKKNKIAKQSKTFTGFIYLWCNIETHDKYVGSTIHYIQRRYQHCQAARKTGLTKDRTPFDTKLARTGIENWVAIPLVVLRNLERTADLHHIERKFVQELQPNMNRIIPGTFTQIQSNMKVSKGLGALHVAKKRNRSVMRIRQGRLGLQGMSTYRTAAKQRKHTKTRYVVTYEDIATQQKTYFVEHLLDRALQEGRKEAIIKWETAMPYTHKQVSEMHPMMFTRRATVIKKYGHSETWPLPKHQMTKMTDLLSLMDSTAHGVAQIEITPSEAKYIPGMNHLYKLSRLNTNQINNTTEGKKAQAYINIQDLNGLFRLYSLTENVYNAERKEKAKYHIMRRLKTKYDIKKIPRPVIKVQYSEALPLMKIKETLKQVLSALRLPTSVREFFEANVRLVNVKHKSIEDRICNHIRFAKNMSAATPLCVCGAAIGNRAEGDDEKWDEESGAYMGHILQKVHQMPPYCAVLQQNAKNIVQPDEEVVAEGLVKQVQGMAKTISAMMRKQAKNQNKGFEWWGPNVQEYDQCIERLQGQIEAASRQQEATMKDEMRAVQNKQHNEMLQEIHKDGFVYSGLDKNNGLVSRACPVAYHYMMTKTFVKDPHYTKILHMSSDDIIQQWKDIYEAHPEWTKIADFNDQANELPYAYILWKNKKLSSSRPIVSSYNHPAKELFNYACRSLMFCAQNLPDEIRHLALFKVGDCAKKLEEIQERFNKKCKGSHWKFKAQIGDVQNMYTDLDHATIKAAVKWAIDLIKEKYKGRNKLNFVVKKEGRGNVRVGKNYNPDEYVTIPADILLELVEYDLDNCYFQVGTDTILQQTTGASIGGVLSTPMAILTCCYFEYQAMKSFENETLWMKQADDMIQGDELIAGVRYTDDAYLIAAYRDDVPPGHRYSEASADARLHRLMNCYHINMKFKKVDHIDGYAHFLESKIAIWQPIENNGMRFDIKHNNKNWQSIKEEGKQRFMKYQTYSSYSAQKVKRGVITGTLCRIQSNCNTVENITEATTEMATELLVLGYPKRMVMDTIREMQNKNAIWKRIHQKVQKKLKKM